MLIAGTDTNTNMPPTTAPIGAAWGRSSSAFGPAALPVVRASSVTQPFPPQSPLYFFIQQFLIFLPLPQGQGLFRPTFCFVAG